MAKIAIVYHSGYGHTAKLAEAVAEGARNEGAEVDVLKADDLTNPIEGPWDTLHAADAIIFGSPTYMGSHSAVFQQFAEATSKIWMSGGWQDKLAAGFTNSASVSGDKLQTLQSFIILASQHGMVWVPLGMQSGYNMKEHSYETGINRGGFFVGVGTQSLADASTEEAPVKAELDTGKALGARVARAAARWG